MSVTRALPAAAVLVAALAAMGCAAATAETRVDGIVIPNGWLEIAEKGGSDGVRQAEVCLALARKLWDRNSLDALQYLRRGAALRDTDCCLQYLAHAEQATVNQSQRVYARLYIEGLLRQGPIVDRRGKDIRAELYQQLCWGWRTVEPCSPHKSQQVLEALKGLGLKPEQAATPYLGQLLRDAGTTKTLVSPRDVQLYAGEAAEEPRRWLRVPAPREVRETADWTVSEVTAWGGGSDRLLRQSNVLAFLVNEKGEPSFHGSRLWICNLGDSPVYLTSLAVGQSNRELAPGREELLPLVAVGERTTGIPLGIRHHRIVR